jgi:tripartite ATP-independent transporter DctP family solute receptor
MFKKPKLSKFHPNTFILAMTVISLLTGSCRKDRTKVIKFSHVGPPEDARQITALKFKDMVETRSKGRIRVEVYYGSQLGGDRDAIEGVRLGTIQMTTAGAGIFANFEPKMGITALPYLFDSLEQAWAFNDSDVNARVGELLLKQNMRVLANWENGFRSLTNSVRAIEQVDDLKGLKIRTPENPVILATLKALGANAGPLPWAEVYMALQQGIFHGQENPIHIIFNQKIYEVQKHLALTRHIYEPMPVVISERFWSGLTTDEQAIVRDAAIEAQTFNRQYIKTQTEQMLEQMKARGVLVTSPDLDGFREVTASVYTQFIDVFGEELINDVYGFIKHGKMD